MKTLDNKVRKNLDIMSIHSRRLAIKHLSSRDYDLKEYLTELANKIDSENLIREGFYLSSVNECLEYHINGEKYYFEKISGEYKLS